MGKCKKFPDQSTDRFTDQSTDRFTDQFPASYFWLQKTKLRYGDAIEEYTGTFEYSGVVSGVPYPTADCPHLES